MGGYDPYSCSKGAAELVASSYRNSFLKEKGILLASARAGNVIGGGDWKTDALIPDIIRAAAEGEVTRIRNPHATRPWQHVLEPLSGYLLLGQLLLEGNEKAAEGWNIGPNTGETLTVADIARISQKSWEDIQFENAYQEGEPYEAKFLSLDISKANTVLDWHPVWSAEKAVDKAIEWYRQFYKEGVLLTDQHLAEFSLAAQSLNRVWATD
jgi:CDP-glucose 4,6-dehydratase